ncbi:glycoside hydrolase family 79 protein [Talaromyces proteolyticus]|uniref:Glycoside hydrolase family 79 protein n=1 Tax=Talaromyces proteolyticus TaxID=1131652 RepID=A0AAD4L492_9EURO|nr:glycoside hydrolase family 79 protein [Talaromyces proteolyticus]KAH8703933.1 glycoside hydrolase family 79 protein [Talaromyces proteolyticus]
MASLLSFLLFSQMAAAVSKGPLYDSFVSLSIELTGFPSFAGTKESPNQFSYNLIKALADAQGSPLVIRVGGNSADRAIYDANQSEATASSCDADPEAILCIGKSFFDSYGAFPNGTTYSHNFNLAASNSSGYDTLRETVPLACDALRGQLNVWEVGNEPDLYRGKWRPSDWPAEDYEADWQNATDSLKTYLQDACADMAANGSFSLMAPSVSSPGSGIKVTDIFNDGENSENFVKQISVHNYMAGASSSGVTVQNTLMSHKAVANKLQSHVNLAESLSDVDADYILGEHNSLYGGGASGKSNVFGAGLWVLEFSAYAASTGFIKREHFHQAVGSAYSAWLPVSKDSSDPQTNPPYYGKLAAATFLANSSTIEVKTIDLNGDADKDSGYGAYVNGTLQRVALLNLREFSSSSGSDRGSQNYTISVNPNESWVVKRLTAPGADVDTGVTFNGYSYEYGTLGLPTRDNSTSSDEKVTSDASGNLYVTVADSEAVIITK